MIVNIKPDILAKFGEKILTGSMIKLSLNLVSKNVSIFEKISILKRIKTHNHTKHVMIASRVV